MKAFICKACGAQETTADNGNRIGAIDLGLTVAGYIDQCALCEMLNPVAEFVVPPFIATNNSESANFSYKVGEVNTTYHTLVKAFGEPINYEREDLDSDGKVQVEWIIEFSNGKIATIYDWKFYDTPFEKVELWNIGGFDSTVVDDVQSVLADAR